MCVLPGIGAFKYSDEAADVAKATGKGTKKVFGEKIAKAVDMKNAGKASSTVDEAIHAADDIVDKTDEVADALTDSAIKNGDEVADGAGVVDDVVETSYGKSSDIFPKPDTTRINLAKGRTRFTPLRESGNPVSAGMQHVIEGHFNRPLSNSRSIFSISIDDLKGILQRKSVIASPISDLGNGQYRRMVDVGENIGNAALKYGGKPTSWIEIITDVKGNIITTYPVPKQ